jgi:RimJ/RimL family protein N-acetyltransferase
MNLLDRQDYGKIEHLLAEMPYHLAPLAILHGAASGEVYVDDARRPRSALIQNRSRRHLVGDPHHPQFNAGLRRYFLETVYPQGQQAGDEAFTLFYPDEEWQASLHTILDGKHPLLDHQEHYHFVAGRNTLPAPEAQELLPDGFELHRLTPELLANDRLEAIQELRQEVLSEAVSQEEFFQHRFGFCLTQGERLAAWCLSEYNWRERCEVGIATREEFQQRGLATAIGSALVEHALAQGLTQIGWHCWKGNLPSAATARKIGYELEKEYPVLLAFYDPVLNLAVHGNVQLRKGEYLAAAAWYARAFAAGEGQAWMYWNAACANARIAEFEDALQYLRLAHEKGFRDLDRMQSSEHLVGLRDLSSFQKILADWYAT